MTQVLGLLTQDCVLLAADRLLTWSGGPRDGAVFRDEECKLVALCGFGGIGYTGLARLENKPTHEWIAIALAEANSKRVADAARALPERLASAVRNTPPQLRGLTLFAAAWDWFGNPPTLRPHFALISNQHDESGNALPATAAAATFRVLTRLLQPAESFAWDAVGHTLARNRATALSRSLRRAIQHGVRPNRLLKYLAAEIQHTSTERRRVGDKILAMSVPRRSVESWLHSGQHFMLAATANSDSATFGYFNPDRRELLQLGPTYVCGEVAVTDLRTKDDLSINSQSSSLKLLRLPSTKNTSIDMP